jgi:hypothetical protein
MIGFGGHSCRLRRPMQNVAEVNLYWIPLADSAAEQKLAKLFSLNFVNPL